MVAGVWFTFIVIILIVFLVLKVVMKKQAIATKLALFIFIALMLTIGYVYAGSDIKIKTAKDVFSFSSVYFSWVLSVFDNMKLLTANVIEKDWSVDNSTETRGR